MQLVNQIPVWVMGKMTAALQITDTDFAYPLKAYAKSAKEELKQQLKAAAAKAGLKPILKCGAFEILSIIKKSVDQLEVRCRKDNLVLAAGRRNGMLAYRPDFEAGRLVKPDEQPWCKDIPPCAVSHRLKPEWSKDRYNWLDKDGVPVEPNYSEGTVAKSLEDQCDMAAVAGPHEVTVSGGEVHGPHCEVGGSKYEEVQVCFGDFAEFADGVEDDIVAASILQVCPKDRLLDMETSALITPQAMESGEKLKRKKSVKLINAKAQSAYLRQWRRKQRGRIEQDGMSRMELLQELVPAVKTSKAQDPGHKAVQKWKKDTKQACVIV
jgi:hypothetical protein